jgi:hypothetical protein
VEQTKERRLPPMMVRLSPLGLRLFIFVVNWNRIQVLCFKYLIAIETADIIDAVSPVKEFGSLVLTTWHSEIFPILISTE